MQSRSGSLFFISLATQALVACCAISLLSVSAFATVTVTPLAPYGLSGTGTVYYFNPKDATPASNPQMDQGFKSFNFTISQGDANEKASGRPNMLQFDISSDKAFTITGTQQLVIALQVSASNGQKAFVPLAFAGAGDCVENGNCQHREPLKTDYLYAARYTQRTILRVGIYLQDLCVATNAITSGGQASLTGCSPAGNYVVPVAIPALFTFTAFVGIAPNSLSTSDATSAPATSDGTADSVAFSVSTHSVSPVYNCPSQAAKAGFYFPGDTEITVNPDVVNGASQQTGGAPIGTLVMIGNETAALDTGGDFFSGNPIQGRFGFGGGQKTIGGFTNTTDGHDHTYTLAFAARDFTGALTDTVGDPNCQIAGVQTADIQGFLSKGNCFIATAAFRATDHPVVAMLREFRDRVLRQSGAGRTFVSWYYRNSPPAAEWLLTHPSARIPVLWFLIPVQTIAWVLLHPAIAIFPAVAALLLLLGFALSRFARMAVRE